MKPQDIETLILAKLPHAHVKVEDPMNDGVHLKATITCEAFNGQPRVAQHRMVYEALGDAFKGPLHALQIITNPTEK